MRYVDKGSSYSDDICNFFAYNFKYVYSDFALHFPYLEQIFNISYMNLSLTDIESSLLSLDKNTSIDCHGMPQAL